MKNPTHTPTGLCSTHRKLGTQVKPIRDSSKKTSIETNLHSLLKGWGLQLRGASFKVLIELLAL